MVGMLFNNILYCFSDIYIIEVLDSNPFSFIIKPYVSRVANNYIGKLDGLLKAIEDKDGKVDIEGILS